MERTSLNLSTSERGYSRLYFRLSKFAVLQLNKLLVKAERVPLKLLIFHSMYRDILISF
jgi:hypothetical protein